MNRSANADDAPKRKPNPVVRANIISQFLFWWLRDLFVLGFRGKLNKHEIYETKAELHSDGITEAMLKKWQAELQRPHPSLMRMLLREYGWPIILLGAAFMLGETVARVVQPLCLGGLVGYFVPGQTQYSQSDAYWFSAGIAASNFWIVLTFHPFFLWLAQRAAVIRLGCSGLMYRKLMQIPRAAVTDGLNGRLINLMSNDVSRFELSLLFMHDIWKGPAETMLFAYFIYQEIGVATFIGIGFLLLFVPLQAWIGKKAATLRLKTALRTDYRVRIMNEIIQGIQVIKMYAWENSFAQMVDRIRKKEIVAVRQTAFVRATFVSFGMISRLSIFISLLSYIFLGNAITARKVFIVSSYFSILNLSMVIQWTNSLTSVAEGYISVKRVEEFLLQSEEKTPPAKAAEQLPKANGKPPTAANDVHLKPVCRRTQNVPAKQPQIVLEHVTARWTNAADADGGEDAGTIGLSDVSLRIAAGELCAVIGQVGAGKSTLLQVLLGELAVDEGSLQIDGRMSYASQEAWLFEGSVRANIVFIETFDEQRYRDVVRVCALERDFELLPQGDRTVVGERGISLSGGQKARINLARAVYKRADIYLLDDPLSAVDTHVGKHMFEQCVRGFLRDRICILITHQVQHLGEAPRVIALNRGRVEAQGTLADLQARNSVAMLLANAPDESGRQPDAADRVQLKRSASVASSSSQSSISSFGDADEAEIDRAEHSNEGTVSWSVYATFLKSVNNMCYVLAIFALFVLAQVGVSAVDYFVAIWVNWEEYVASLPNLNEVLPDVLNERHVYIIVYCVLMVVASYLFIHRTFAFFALCMRATTNLHDEVFRGISRATMFFYNTNPSGRILNRFAKDISNIDVLLPPALMDTLSMFFELLASMAIIVSVNYWMIIPTVILVAVIYGVREIYLKTARSIKRIESVSFSPIYSHANATLQGLSTIRAFGANEILQQEFHTHLDRNTGDWFCRIATTRAFAFWMDNITSIYVLIVTISFVAIGSEETKSGNVGLAIMQSIGLVGYCQWAIRQSAEVESQMTSVERLSEYAQLPSEAPLETAAEHRPPADWPTAGAIRFERLSFRYTPDSAFVLRDMQLDIAAKEKIGIVGRTGAGKSSLIQALFRLAELDGVIRIDGVDISQLGLHQLRMNISIIPQDPVLFSGTLRFNLDPFDERSDAELWSALEQVELRSVVTDMPGGLDSRMSDGGSNFSVGQRQMVCLARAILRQNRILILDEATANVDPETDRLIQTTIRARFGDCTVLTIAHRLHTVMDSDRVLVVDAGRAVQFGHPYELLQQSGGPLSALVEQTGTETAGILADIAYKSYASKQKTE